VGPREPLLIDRETLEARLEAVRGVAPDPVQGLFGPDSMTWQVSRESLCFLGAGRALVLQLAHPWVAQAIEDHSPVKRDPAGRFYRTFRPVFAMVFGTRDQAFVQARAVHRIHSHIRGTLPETLGPFPAGSSYNANEAQAALWVHATLCHTAVLVYERVLPPLTAAQKDRYWDEARRFAALFGIPDGLLPPDWNVFSAYVESMLESDVLAVGQAARAIGDHLLSRAPGAFGRLIPGWYRGLTASLLPARLRVAFGLSYGRREAAQVARALDQIRRLYPRLPAVLRFVGPYQEALARLGGQTAPSLFIRASNLLWLGRTGLGR
jgi:uncharacterized protein (DUF2236 family)